MLKFSLLIVLCCYCVAGITKQSPPSSSSSSSSSSSTSTTADDDDFTCPEEFGYFPKLNDCSKYYVCVFGGALLESCTGGLEYSHELQTCDWPRNVDCYNASNLALLSPTSSSSSSGVGGRGTTIRSNDLDENSVGRLGRRSYAGNVPDYRQELREQREQAVIYGRLTKKSQRLKRHKHRDKRQVTMIFNKKKTQEMLDLISKSSNKAKAAPAKEDTSSSSSASASVSASASDDESDEYYYDDDEDTTDNDNGEGDELDDAEYYDEEDDKSTDNDLNQQRSVNSAQAYQKPPPQAPASQQQQQYEEYYNTRYAASVPNYTTTTTTSRPIYNVREYYPPTKYEPLTLKESEAYEQEEEIPLAKDIVRSRYESQSQTQQQYSRQVPIQHQQRLQQPTVAVQEYSVPASVAPPTTRTQNTATKNSYISPSQSTIKEQQYYEKPATYDSDYYLYDDEIVPGQEYDVDYQQPAAAIAPQTTTTTTTKKPPRGTARPQQQQAYQSYNSNNQRPTLKPSTKLLKDHTPSVPRDVYVDLPSRPDPVYVQPEPNSPAKKCKRDACVLPDCNCGGKWIPGDLSPSQVPQIVMITFDDSVNDLNKGLYRDLFEKGRKNPNGCPISATFYVSHEWTDYSQVQNLAADGHEIASHSITHSFGEQFTPKKWDKEITGQREILAAYGGVKLNDIRGMRAPFLAIGGNSMFKMLYESNWTYDSSMPVYENNPPSWPYTLDYKIFHDCMIPPCPTKSYPGVWEVPMVMWQDLKGGRCSMADACSNPPDAEGVYQMLAKNFERHYNSNRAPFGMYYHAAWFTQAHHKEGFEQFLDALVQMDDVYLVTNWQALQWVRNPTPLSQILNFEPWSCSSARNLNSRPPRCNSPRVCNLWHKSGVRYLKTCQSCPEKFPWTGNTGVLSPL